MKDYTVVKTDLIIEGKRQYGIYTKVCGNCSPDCIFSGDIHECESAIRLLKLGVKLDM